MEKSGGCDGFVTVHNEVVKALRLGLVTLVPCLVATGCRNDVLLGELALDGGPTVDAGSGSRIGPSSRIPWDGTDYFLYGASLPWVRYSFDFGGANGLSNAATLAAAESAFQDATAGSFRAVRWLMFAAPDSVAPPPLTYSSEGVVTGFQPEVFRDLDIALDLAERYNVYLTLAVFAEDQPSAALLADPAQRQGLSDAVAALVQHAAPSGRVVAWEISPDVGTREQLVDLIRRVAPAVRETRSYLTARVITHDQAAQTCAAGADFVGFGHLIANGRVNALTSSYGAVDPSPGCPIIVDLIFVTTDGGTDVLRTINDRGWAGAFGWLLRLESGSPDPEQRIDLSQAASFAASLPETGPP